MRQRQLRHGRPPFSRSTPRTTANPWGALLPPSGLATALETEIQVVVFCLNEPSRWGSHPGTERRARARLGKAIRAITLFADAGSRALYVYLKLRNKFVPRRAPRMVWLKCRDLPPVAVRSHTADLAVLVDTLLEQYHRPPAGIGAPSSILDLGSNIGLTLLDYARVFPQARLFGVELDPDNYSVLSVNTASIGPRCKAMCAAVWHQNGIVSYGGASEAGYRVSSAPQRSSEKGTARAITVSEALDQAGFDHVDYLKMDIEGAESVVLPHSAQWMARVGCLKVEIHAPYSVDQCMADLRLAGWHCERDDRHSACVTAWNPQYHSMAPPPR